MRTGRWMWGAAMLASVVTCAAQTTPGNSKTAPTSAVLADSEIYYAESGGIAGRTREARFIADSGNVKVEYRGAEAEPTSTPLEGDLDPKEYVALWEEAERLRPRDIASPPRSRGMDLIEHALTIRSLTETHTIRWNAEPTPETLRGVEALGQRLLNTAREVAQNK